MKAKIYLLFASITCLTLPFHNIAQSTILLDENFNSGSLPSGWSNIDNESYGDKWAFNDPDNRNISAGNFSGDYAILDSDYYGSSSRQDAELITPSFDASSYDVITLEFDHQYRDYNGPEACSVDVFNGSSWVNVLNYQLGDENYSGSDLVSVNITSQTNGNANCKVRFRYEGRYDWWWAIDNVKITGSTLSASEGPGGIATDNLALWLDANQTSHSNNDNVTLWEDLSVNGNDATANSWDAPAFKTGQMNNYPVIEFDESNQDYLTISNDNSLNPNEISLIVVGRYESDSESWAPFVIKSSDWNWDDGYALARNNGENKIIGYINEYDENYVKTSLSTNSDNIMSLIYDKDDVITYFNENEEGSDSYSSNISNTSNDMYLGASPNSNGTGVRAYLEGEIAEVIMFNNAISEVERIVLHNYLAAKYGISLDDNDFYTRDNNGQGNFDHHVSGIGKASDGSELTLSRGTGIVTMKAETSLSSNDYLFWGENMKDADYSFSTSSTDYMDRMTSTWRVSTNNSPGSVTVYFDSSEINLSEKTDCAELKLSVSNSSNFQSKTTYSLVYEDGQYKAENVNFNNGDYFSLEYQDVIAIDQNGYHGGSGSSEAPNSSDECFKLLITSTANGNYDISSNAKVREIEVESGGEITINSGVSLTSVNEIVNNGEIEIEENGSLIQLDEGTNSNSGSGNYTIYRSGNTNSYIYNIWSSPIDNASLTTVFADANPCDIWTFEATSQSWKYDFTAGSSANCNGNNITFPASFTIALGDGVMDVTQGYFIPGDLTPTRMYSGEVNNGDYTASISTTNLGNPGGSNWGDDDWNLLGNPYPSGLDAAAFWQENAIDNNRIKDALYFWDEADTTGGYNQTSDYASWSASGAVESGNSNKLPLGAIASGQGFWTVANTSTDVVFNNSMRVETNSQFFKTQQEENHNAWFSLESPSGIKNKILVGYNDHTTDGIDQGYDAHKLVGNGHLRLASLINNEEFVINSLGNFTIKETKTIPLVVFSDETGVHTFTEYRRQRIPNGFKIYLRDRVLGTDFDLSTGNYQVSLQANVEYKTRFELVFKNYSPKVTIQTGLTNGSNSQPNLTDEITNMEEIDTQKFQLAFSESGHILSHPDGIHGTLRIIDITGKVLWSQRINSGDLQVSIPTHGLTQGLYFLELHDDQERLYQNKIIK